MNYKKGKSIFEFGPLTIYLSNYQAFILALILVIIYPFFIIGLYNNIYLKEGYALDLIGFLFVVELMLIIVAIVLYIEIKKIK